MRGTVVASAIFLTGSVLAGCAVQAQTLTPTIVMDADNGPVAPPKQPRSFDPTSIDKSADPCTNFYQFACGNWIKNNPIPPSETRWGTFNVLADRNRYLLYQDLKAAADHPQTALQTKYGNYFAACMNTPEVDKQGAQPIDPELKAIDQLENKKKIADLDVELAKQYGGDALFQVMVGQDQKDSTQQILQTGQGGLSLPDRDYYLSQDERYVKIRQQYVEHVTKMFTLLGDAPDKAKAEADDVMRIETALAKGSMPRVEMRNPANRYHIKTVAELEQMSPEFSWKTYLDGMGLDAAKSINVSSPGFVEAANQQIESEPLPALKAYMRWHVLHTAAPALSKPFEEEDFDFFHRTLAGQKEEQPRWKRCTALTDRALGEAVGQDWVKQNFKGDSKTNMEQLVAELKKALAQDIKTLPWMSEQTKQEAELKLAAFRQKIGYPEKWRDYSSLTVKRDDFLGNLQRAEIFEHNRNLHKLGKPVDETEWGMTPPTVNAYYNPPQNDINFPAGILQPPFYDNSADPAVNFGGIGVVIGHEMTHGFDDQGSKYGPTGNVKYDENGKIGSWFTPEDQKKFNERTKCVADEYSGFSVAPGQNLNGNLTLGENTADNGGIRIAYQALQEVMAKDNLSETAKKDGYTPAQRFFISFGQVWCQNQTEQSARISAKIDPHSSGEWRTNGTVQNFDEFGKAFGCKVGQPMMPEHSCRVW